MDCWLSLKILLVTFILVALSHAQAIDNESPTLGFGTKVGIHDADIGLPLETFSGVQDSPATISFWDIGSVPFIPDESDIIYLDFAPFGINANDIRLTKYGDKEPGSQVQSSDNDIGLTSPNILQTPWVFKYIDGSGATSGYDLNDSVYIGSIGPTLLNNIRITKVMGYLPGSRVKAFESDFNSPTSSFVITPFIGFSAVGPLANIKFYNANGNQYIVPPSYYPVYDAGDTVYIDIPCNPYAGTVSVGDIRLTPFNY